MRILLTASENYENSPLDPRFGRCAYFHIYDTETRVWQVYPNPAANSSGGAGVRAAQYIIDFKPDAVISGNFGPNAFEVLESAGIPVFTCKEVQNLSRVVKSFMDGELTRLQAPTRSDGFHQHGRNSW